MSMCMLIKKNNVMCQGRWVQNALTFFYPLFSVVILIIFHQHILKNEQKRHRRKKTNYKIIAT